MWGRVRFPVAVAAILCIILAVTVVVLTSPTSRELSIDELRKGTDFVLGLVRFTQTRFVDNQNGPVVDGGYVVSFLIEFPDASTEDFDFAFDGFCPFGSVNEQKTVHQGPATMFRHVCGTGFIRVVLQS